MDLPVDKENQVHQDAHNEQSERRGMQNQSLQVDCPTIVTLGF